MHFFELQDDLKRRASYAYDDFLELDSQIDDIRKKLKTYIPFTGDNHAREHLDITIQVQLVRARLHTLETELRNLLYMLNTK